MCTVGKFNLLDHPRDRQNNRLNGESYMFYHLKLAV